MFGSKKQKTPKLPKYQAAIYINHLEGINSVPYYEGVAVHVRTGESDLEMEYKQEKILLPLSQITKVSIITWEKTFIKERSPTNAALLGGLIGGEAMAIASAIEVKGKTKTEKVKLENALEIQYHPRGDSRTIQRLVFWDKLAFSSKSETIEFAEKLCRLANLPGPNFVEPKPKEPTYL